MKRREIFKKLSALTLGVVSIGTVAEALPITETDLEKVKRIIMNPEPNTNVKYSHYDEVRDQHVYVGNQQYPHVVRMHNPFDFNQFYILVDKDRNGKIIKTRVEYKA